MISTSMTQSLLQLLSLEIIWEAQVDRPEFLPISKHNIQAATDRNTGINGPKGTFCTSLFTLSSFRLEKRLSCRRCPFIFQDD